MSGIHHRLIARLLPLVPGALLWPFSKRYIAGSTLDEALEVVRDLNGQGCMATLDVLGEDVRDPAETRRNTALYLDALDRIDREGLDSNVSLKLSAVGQSLDRALCLDNTRRILEAARERGNFVRFDMEDAETTDSTLGIYRELRHEGYENMGVCLQSRLRRTLQDVRDLAHLRPNYRLCKGIYLEPERIAFQEDEAISANFLAALEAMLESGSYVGIASHDPPLLEQAEAQVKARGLDREDYEFQMLLGVAEGLRARLVERGHRLRVYVPYGEQWRAYSLRRLQENPELVGHILGNLLRRRR